MLYGESPVKRLRVVVLRQQLDVTATTEGVLPILLKLGCILNHELLAFVVERFVQFSRDGVVAGILCGHDALADLTVGAPLSRAPLELLVVTGVAALDLG